MPLRSAHGNAKEHGLPGPRVEVCRPSELPPPVPAPIAEPPLVTPRLGGNRFTPGDAAREAGRRGGAAKAGHAALARGLGLGHIVNDEAFRPYLLKAATFRRQRCAEMAAIAGGTCGSGPSSMVATAALQLAASRYLYDVAMQAPRPDINTMKEARQQGDSARQNLLAAYELAVREAQRRQLETVDPLEAFKAKDRAMRAEGELRKANEPADVAH